MKWLGLKVMSEMEEEKGSSGGRGWDEIGCMIAGCA